MRFEAPAADNGRRTRADGGRSSIRDFFAGNSDGRVSAAVIRTKYGRQCFETKEAFIGFQRGCHHPSAGWVHDDCHESYVCERCWAVLEVGWPDHHPSISQWLNDGGSVRASDR